LTPVSTDGGDTRRAWRIAILVAIATISTLQLGWLCDWPGQGVDDSLITQVYGRNLAEGSGWVYHPGAGRVEGTTSFLYTLLWSAAFGTPAPRAVMHVLGFLLCVTALLLGHSISGRLGRASGRPSAVTQWWFVLLAALYPPLVTWSTLTLMDSTLWLALVMAAAWLLVRAEGSAWGRREQTATMALAALMPLTRPEGFLVAPVWLGLISLRSSNCAARLDARRALPGVATFLSASLALTAFRWLYFGHPLPNTYYAKVSPSVGHNILEGTEYLLRTLALSPVAAGALVLAFVAAMRRPPRQASNAGWTGCLPVRTLSWLAMVLVGATVVVGGDHFAQGRFLVPPLTLGLVVAAAVLARATPFPQASRVEGRSVVAALCVLAVAATAGARAVQERWDPVAMEFVVGRCGLEFGRALNRITAGMEARPSWGVFAAGGTAFSYEGRVVDLLGLNNPAMAHSPGDRRGRKNHAAFNRVVFYEQAPDLVQESVFTECVNRPRRAFRRRLTRGFTGGIQEEAEFQRRYVPMVVPLAFGDRRGRAERTADEDGPCVEGMAVYVEGTVAETLAGAGAQAVQLPEWASARGD
jgi:arabinofuranosyltransferase